jgi:hypothetical protein
MKCLPLVLHLAYDLTSAYMLALTSANLFNALVNDSPGYQMGH